MITFINEHCCKITLKNSVHYFERANIVDICMEVEEYDDYPMTTYIPTIKIYVRKNFLWCIPYKSLALAIIPMKDILTDEERNTLRSFFSKLYEWWKYPNAN